jgi:type I restriction enzyme S subunit
LSAPLGDIADTSLGKMLDRGKSSGHPEVPYLRNVNVQWGRIDVSDVLTMEMPPEQQEFFRLRAGDLLVCEGGEIGRCAVWPGGGSFMAFQKALHRIRPSKAVDARFLRYQLEHMHLVGLLVRFATGSTIKHLPQQQLRRLPVLVPPLLEQHRIVEALEDHLSRLDAATVNLRRVRPALKQLRKAILSDCTSGPRYEAAAWRGARLGDLIDGVEAGKSFACESRPATKDEWGVIKVSAMTWGEFRPGEQKAIPHSRDVDPRFEIHSGDLLLSRANTEEYVGAPVLVRQTRSRLLLSDKSLRLSVPDHVDKEWLLLALASPAVRRQISAKSTGMKHSMRNISQAALLDVTLMVPPEDEQSGVANSTRAALQEVHRLEASLDGSQLQSQALRRALLDHAFSGQLVLQDPSAEPASALFDLVNAERSAAPKPVGRDPSKGVSTRRSHGRQSL